MTRQPRKPRQAAFIFVFITVALDMLALGVVIPVLPELVEGFVGGDTARTAQVLGVFGTGWALMQFLFQPVLGGLSDRYGRRPVILISSLGLGLDYIFMAMAPSLGWLFAGRLISGLTAASFATAAAYIVDVTPTQERAAKFGMLSAAFGFGFVVGPALGGLLGNADPRTPFWVAGALSVLNTIYGAFVLPESLPADKRSAFEWRKANPIGSLVLFRSQRALWGLAVVTFLANLAHEVLPSITVLYSQYRFHWDTRSVGFFLAAIGISSAVVQGGLTHHIVRLLGERSSLLWGTVFGAAGFCLLGLAPYGWLFVCGIPLWSFFGVAGAAGQTIMSECVDSSAQGRLQGALGSLRGVTGIMGPSVFSLLFAKSIAPSWDMPGAPYLLATLLLLCSLVVTVIVTKPQATPAQTDV